MYTLCIQYQLPTLLSHWVLVWCDSNVLYFLSLWLLYIGVWLTSYLLSSVVHDGSRSGHRPAYNGVYDAFRRILKQDGFTGLYRVMPDTSHTMLCNIWHTALCTVLYSIYSICVQLMQCVHSAPHFRHHVDVSALSVLWCSYSLTQLDEANCNGVQCGIHFYCNLLAHQMSLCAFMSVSMAGCQCQCPRSWKLVGVLLLIVSITMSWQKLHALCEVPYCCTVVRVAAFADVWWIRLWVSLGLDHMQELLHEVIVHLLCSSFVSVYVATMPPSTRQEVWMKGDNSALLLTSLVLPLQVLVCGHHMFC